MMRGAKPKDSLLDRYDHENLLMPRIQGVMKDAIARINAGETLLRLRIILLASLVGALIYLVPFQHALAALGAEALIGSFSNISAWFWGSLVTLWATPFLAMRAFIYERRIRRAERSAQIFGEPRKEETGRDLKTFFAVLVGQTAIMFGTFFLPEPLYPQPCQAPVSDSKSACIAMGLTYSYIGLFLTLHRDFEANTGAAVEVPHLADFAKGVAVHRAYY